MASLQKKGDTYYCQFFYQHHRRTFTVGKVTQAAAESRAEAVDVILAKLERGQYALPDGVDIVDFVVVNGDVRKLQKTAETPPRPQPASLEAIRDQYAATHAGALEENTLATIRMHLGHFVRSFGSHFVLQGLTTAKLQEHIDRRKAMRGTGGKKLSPVTLKKEVATLRAVWNWATHMGLVVGVFPNRGLVYPKADEKPPFMTWPEVERRIAAGGNADELWDCLYLTLAEIDELLAYVKEHAAHRWIYALVVFAAHTGARRSEILRVKTSDVDFDGRTVTLQEKKRTKGKRTSRRVPMSSFLVEVLKQWLAVHPGGHALFCQQEEVFRSKKRSKTTGHQNEKVRPSSWYGRMATVKPRSERPGLVPLTRREVSDHFERTLAGGKWQVLRGLHVLRHSFISNLASRGVDQRLIDEWAGHTTEEMRRRYRHLLPSTQQEVLDSVFGKRQ
jgi:integrase